MNVKTTLCAGWDSQDQCSIYFHRSDGGLEMTKIERDFGGKYHCTATTQYGTTPSDKGEFKVKCKFCMNSLGK